LRWSCLAAAVAAAVLLAGCGAVGGAPAGPPGLIEPAGVELSMTQAERGTLTLALRGTGVVIPEYTEYVHFEIDGTLAELLVKPGDRVKAGDVLLRLSGGNFELERMRQQLALEQRQSTLAGAIRAGETDQTRLEILRLDVQIERLRLERLEERHRKRELIAPVDGIVTFLNAGSVGSSVEAFQPLIGISPTDRLRVHYFGDIAEYMSRLRLGMPVRLVYKGSGLEGSIAEGPWTLQADGDPVRGAVNSRTLRFAFEGDPPPGIEFGDAVDFTIELEKREDTLMIPRSALRNYQGRNYVLIVEGGMRREVNVSVGLFTRTKVEILSGLEEGQRIANSFH